MTRDALAAELDVEPFRPMRLALEDGQRIDIQFPYLSFILGDALYAARATSLQTPGGGVELLQMRDILAVEHLCPS